MAVKRVVKKRPAVPMLSTSVREYANNRSLRERSEYHEKQIKAQLMEVLAQVGQPDGDENQHLRLDLDEPVEYVSYSGAKAQPKKIVAIQRQFRAGSMNLDQDKVMAFLASLTGARRALYERCLYTVQMVDEDALLAANFEKLVTDDEMRSLYNEAKPTYAFQIITE